VQVAGVYAPMKYYVKDTAPSVMVIVVGSIDLLKGMVIVEMMKTKMFLTVTTGFKQMMDSGDDITKWAEERFHDAVHDVFEDFMAKNDDFEQLVLDKMIEHEQMDDFFNHLEIDEFNKLGDVIISISDLETIEAFTPSGKVVPREQQRLVVT